MTKHIYTFGELEKGDHIFRYRIVNDEAKLETLVIKDIKITNNKAIIEIKDSFTVYTIDKDRQYVTRGNINDDTCSAIVSDYELLEFIRTVIDITKCSIKNKYMNFRNYVFN